MTKPTVRNIKLKLGMDLSSPTFMFQPHDFRVRVIFISHPVKPIRVKIFASALRTVKSPYSMSVFYRNKVVQPRVDVADLDEVCLDEVLLQLLYLNLTP